MRMTGAGCGGRGSRERRACSTMPSVEEAEFALRLLTDKYEQYQRARPHLPVLALDIRNWRSWPSEG